MSNAIKLLNMLVIWSFTQLRYAATGGANYKVEAKEEHVTSKHEDISHVDRKNLRRRARMETSGVRADKKALLGAMKSEKVYDHQKLSFSSLLLLHYNKKLQ